MKRTQLLFIAALLVVPSVCLWAGGTAFSQPATSCQGYRPAATTDLWTVMHSNQEAYFLKRVLEHNPRLSSRPSIRIISETGVTVMSPRITRSDCIIGLDMSGKTKEDISLSP